MNKISHSSGQRHLLVREQRPRQVVARACAHKSAHGMLTFGPSSQLLIVNLVPVTKAPMSGWKRSCNAR